MSSNKYTIIGGLVVIFGLIRLMTLITFRVDDTISFISSEKGEQLILNAPKAHEVVFSPLTITGEARGTWFFEATFPLVLVDWDGRIIAESYATAREDWMTPDFVPFSGTLTFDTPTYRYSNRGALILRKSNASGLSEHDDAVEIPILFSPHQ